MKLAAACARQDIKLGFYYSQSQDWHHKGGAGNTWDPRQRGDYDLYLDSIAVPQVRELLSHYGPVAVLWYDTPRHMTEERARRFLALQALQPGLIVNDRLRTPMEPDPVAPLGDFTTPEQFIPAGYAGRDWETCMTMNNSWGFNRNDHDWKSTETLLRDLSDIASKGGNFLLNVGPTGEGVVPPESVERLKEMGAWLSRNGEAIYGTRAGPFVRHPDWGRATQRTREGGGTTLYLHIWNWPVGGKLILPGVHGSVLSCRLLAGGAPITAADSPEGLVTALPTQPSDSPIAVAALDFAGPVATSQALPAPRPDGVLSLTPIDADLSGPDDDKPYVIGSGELAVLNARAGWRARYTFSTPRDAVWAIEIEVSSSAYNRLSAAAPGPFGSSVTTSVQAWGPGPGSFQKVELGLIRLPAGENALDLKSEMDDARPVQIRHLWLRPL